MNSFQVEQCSGKPLKSGHLSRTFTRLSLLSTTLVMVVLILLVNNNDLTSFAQNLPKPQRVLGISSQNAYCDGTPYQKPGALALDTLQPGLQYTDAEPQFYNLQGSTIDELRSAITNCDVREQSGDFHALTTYTMNWQYDTQASAGQCTIANVKIGLATNQYLPRLADSQRLTPEDRAIWDAYYANLVQHENQHLELNKKYAADLLTALSTLSASCNTIDSYASSVITTHVQLLNSANSLLDSKTNHGADTGAVL